jgi:leucyl aminopeptidase
MEIRLVRESVTAIACDALVVAVSRPRAAQRAQLSPAAEVIDSQLERVIEESCAGGAIKGNLGEVTSFYTFGRLPARRVVVLGLGNPEDELPRTLRRASGTALRRLQELGARRVALALEGAVGKAGFGSAEAVQAQVEGSLLGLYRFEQYKSERAESREEIAELLLVVGQPLSEELEAALQRGQALAEATNFARDLVNEPPNVLTPAGLAERARALAAAGGMECEILERPQMEALGMGGLLAVARGSGEPPYLIILRYRGAPADGSPAIALVGKGITFDSGGLSLKSAEGMVTMKGDMAGAAAVLGAMQAIARLKLPINVTALVPATENMPGGRAYRPGDILRIMNGKTIEIVNTDAEGRLALADAMSYAVREGLTPIIDVATLTGAIGTALGSVYAGLFSNDEQLSAELIAAGRAVGEKLWALPLDEEYGEQIQSDVADIKQTGGRLAGSITAAKILEHFAGNASWAHLDIASTSFLESARPYQEKGATGMAVRTLAEFVRRRSNGG